MKSYLFVCDCKKMTPQLANDYSVDFTEERFLFSHSIDSDCIDGAMQKFVDQSNLALDEFGWTSVKVIEVLCYDLESAEILHGLRLTDMTPYNSYLCKLRNA